MMRHVPPMLGLERWRATRGVRQVPICPSINSSKRYAPPGPELSA